MLPYQILAFTTHGKTQKSHTKSSKFNILARTWNDKFEYTNLPLSHVIKDFVLVECKLEKTKYKHQTKTL